MCGALLPPLQQTALFLDLDGTLLDIAAAPDKVVVPAGLVDTLRMVRGLLDDAIAIITGRPIETIDALLDDAPFAVAGEHGAAIRPRPGEATTRPPLPVPPASWIAAAKTLVAAHPGALFEPKPHGFSLHYRAVPSAGPPLREGLTALLAGSGDFALLPGNMIWEARPRSIDKGKALMHLMSLPPFHGRLPVFVGDDVTDEDAIAAAASLGGVGLRVADAFGDAAGVRAWLGDIAANRDWPAPSQPAPRQPSPP